MLRIMEKQLDMLLYVVHVVPSLLQFTASSSSIMASFSALVDLAHFSWIAGGTLHFPEGFFSQSRLKRFSFAPSVSGGGLSAGGIGLLLALAFGALLTEEEPGVRAGEGAGILGGGVAMFFFFSRAEEARSFSISSCILLLASPGISTLKTHKTVNALNVNHSLQDATSLFKVT